MTIHQRTTSNSFRISIPGSPARDSLQQGLGDRSARKEKDHHQHHLHGRSTSTSYPHSTYKRAFWQDAAVTPASAPIRSRGPSPTFSVRLTRRQIALLLGSVLAIIVLLRQTRGGSNITIAPRASPNKTKNIKNKNGPFTPDGVPIVDRGVVFDRIRQIEEENAWEDEDEDEARSAGRLPIKYHPAQPAVYKIPDGKPRNRPKMTEQDLEAYRQTTLQEATILDQEYCPNHIDGCKFLLPAWLGEQETKAQMHLYQLGLLAIALNRTLVLPNVSKSRMMSCASQPFEFYYDATSLEDLGIPTISYQRFLDWSSKRLQEPTSQIVAVSSPSNDWSAGALEIDPAVDPSTIPSLPKRKLCLERPKAYLNFTSYSPITVYPPSHWHKQPETRALFGESLINTLKSLDVRQRSYRTYNLKGFLLRWLGGSSVKKEAPPSPDVLVFNYELRYPILHYEQLQDVALASENPVNHPNIMALQDFRHFPYASIWTDLALQVVSSISPFIAIHWRQETLPADIIAPCGEALIDELETLLLTKPGYDKIKTVYLATDYPIEDLENGWDGAIAHSGTFGKLLTEEHHSAMRSFLKLFRTRLTDPFGVRMTTFSQEQARLKFSDDLLKAITPSVDNTRPAVINDRNSRPRKKSVQLKVPKRGLDLAELDIGLLGIIDKTIAMHAQVFLTGLPWSNAKEVQASACAKESSFTKQISEARRLERSKSSSDGEENIKLWNDVDYWSRQ